MRSGSVGLRSDSVGLQLSVVERFEGQGIRFGGKTICDINVGDGDRWLG